MDSPNATKLVTAALHTMLRPIVRLCLRRSLHLPEVVEVLKSVFVDVARDELTRQQKPVSLSRLSVMTGVHRRDVTRIEREEMPQRRPESLISRVMGQWQNDPRFGTKARKPKILNVEGKDSDFAELVRSINGEDVSAYAVLHEMLRLGIVVRDGNTVKLVWQNFVPDGDLHRGLGMWAADVDDLGAAVEENLFEPVSTRNLHLKTEFDNIASESLSTIREWMIREGSDFHRRVREFLSLHDKDINPDLANSSGGCRVVLGSFSLARSKQEKM